MLRWRKMWCKIRTMIPYTHEQLAWQPRPKGRVACVEGARRTSQSAQLPSTRQVHIVPYQETFSEFCTRYFVTEKVDLTMSKGSLMGLVLGLMLLGILFFLSGFLAAVHLYTPGPSALAAALPPEHSPLATPYHIPTQATYATSSSSRMPSSSAHLPSTPQRTVVVPTDRHPSPHIMQPPYTIPPTAPVSQPYTTTPPHH